MNILDKATSCFQKQLPFVLYAKPNEAILNGIFQKNASLNVFENQIGFVFASFHNETNVVFPLSDSESCKEQFDFEVEEGFVQIENDSNKDARILFENLVQNAVSEIEKGTFEKVVLSRKMEVSQQVDIIKS